MTDCLAPRHEEPVEAEAHAVLPGYCDRCGHTLAEHAEAGVCTFTCDCYAPGEFCGCDRSDLARVHP